MNIDQARLAKVMQAPLLHGAHQPNSKMCVMEAVAYVAGLPWSDSPECVCPVIGAFMRNWNDSLSSDEDRNRLLKPLILTLLNTKSTPAIEERRSYMALDWLIRVMCEVGRGGVNGTPSP